MDELIAAALGAVGVAEATAASPLVRQIVVETFAHPRRRSVIVADPDSGRLTARRDARADDGGRGDRPQRVA